MAAQAKTIHPFKSPDQDHGSTQAYLGESDRRVVRHDFDDRRRMSVSEKLAEGRGFWRGAFVGASIGAAAGMAGSVGVADMWTGQVLDTVQRSAIVAQTFGGADAAHAVPTVHHEVEMPPPTPTGEAK
jgi:hypothetical protein